MIQQITVLLHLVLNISSSFLLVYVCYTCLWKPAHVHILWIKEYLNGLVVITNICTIFKGFEEADVEAAKKKKEKKKGSKWKFVFIWWNLYKIHTMQCPLLIQKKMHLCIYAIFIFVHVSLYDIGRNFRGDIILALKIAYCSSYNLF